jgi:restriction system protein
VERPVLEAIGLVVVIAVIVWLARLAAVQKQKIAQAVFLRNSELAVADAMTGPQFEQYFADLLRRRGHTNVQVVGGAGDGGVDILGTTLTGRAVAYQCKRQGAKVGVGVVRQLIGSINYEHQGRAGCLVTTAYLTKPAADLARKSGIRIVDRPKLGQLMADARQQLSASATYGAVPQPPAQLNPPHGWSVP